MTAFKMACSCGDTMTVDTENRDEAVSKFKGMMDEAGIAAHMTEKHPGAPLIPVSTCHAMIEKDVVAV